MKASRRFPLFLSAAALVSLAGVITARADEVVVAGAAPTVDDTRPSRAALSGGLFTFGVPYIASIVVAAESSHPGDKDLYIPVAGPWIDLGDRHCGVGESCNHEGLNKAGLIVDGIFQGLGAIQIVGAFLFPERVEFVRTAERAPLPQPEVHVGFSGVGSGYGLAAVGSF